MEQSINQFNNHQTVEVGKRNLQAPNHWELLDLDNLKFKKPTVVCLCGNDTKTNAKANGFVKQAETYLDLMFKTKDGRNVLDNVDIVGMKYDELGRVNESDSEKVSKAIFDLLVDENGKRLDIEEARKNMSRLNFFTYCYGHNVLQNINEALNSKLSQVGYSENEIKLINNSTLEVAYAPMGYRNKVPSVRVISEKDQVVGFPDTELYDNYRDIKDSIGVCLHKDEPGKIYGREASDVATAGCIQIVSSGILNGFYQKNPNGRETNVVGFTLEDPTRQDHAVAIVARDKDWNLKNTTLDGVSYYSPNADCVSEMMAWSLCKGVENSLQNFKSDKYIPNDYWNELQDDLQSIVDSYDHNKLLSTPQDISLER